MNTAPFNAHSSLPLSRPAFNMKMKKCKEPKAKPTFDPATAQRVIDLINTDPKTVKTERSVEKNKFKKKQKEEKKAKKQISKSTKKKSKCACIEYVKNKLTEKKKKNPFKDPNAVKVKPPGTNSKISETSTKSTAVISKMSSLSKIQPTSTLEKNLHKRRTGKRTKIQGAIKLSKSQSEQNISSSKSKSASRSGSRSKRSENSTRSGV